jgi:hypothetical protein
MRLKLSSERLIFSFGGLVPAKQIEAIVKR